MKLGLLNWVRDLVGKPLQVVGAEFVVDYETDPSGRWYDENESPHWLLEVNVASNDEITPIESMTMTEMKEEIKRFPHASKHLGSLSVNKEKLTKIFRKFRENPIVFEAGDLEYYEQGWPELNLTEGGFIIVIQSKKFGDLYSENLWNFRLPSILENAKGGMVHKDTDDDNMYVVDRDLKYQILADLATTRQVDFEYGRSVAEETRQFIDILPMKTKKEIYALINQNGVVNMSDLHGLFDEMIDTVMSLPDEPLAGLEYWREVKQDFSDTPLPDMEWVCPPTEGFDPQDKTGEFVVIDGVQQATPLHFTNQIKRIPMINKPNERKIMQMALNIAQAVRKGQLNKNEMMFHDVVVNI